jgi:CubicO group peptidase (beta-lactamase class C family)
MRTAAALLALLLLGTATPIAPAVAAPTSVSTQRLDSLDAFVDGVLAQQLASREVAGAVVTIVHDGRTILSRGYGMADVEAGRPVDPVDTLVRPGSVSKLITWVALMQQVEQGRVDLDADVNRYLDFTIPPFEGQPIRVRDLMSHSPGFSDVPGIITRDPAKLLPFRQWMKANIPGRHWPAGTEVAYSNYGAALAGYIVEQTSGETFDDYVERHVFKPLGMASTSFREPLPPALAPRLARGYQLERGRFVAQPPELISAIAPAGSASSTGADMARFMIALLREGRAGNTRVLSPASVRLLMSDSLANAPGLPAVAHGFMVHRISGPRLVGHGGNTADFHSILILAPEARLGFFISMTGGDAAYAARTELADALVGRLFPTRPALRVAAPAGEVPPIGTFRMNRRNFAVPPHPAHHVTLAAAGPGAVTLMADGKPSHWERIGPGLYEKVTGTGPDGPFDKLQVSGTPGTQRLAIGSQPHVLYHQVPEQQAPRPQPQP